LSAASQCKRAGEDRGLELAGGIGEAREGELVAGFGLAPLAIGGGLDAPMLYSKHGNPAKL
jgi:hypothetical protein